MPDVHMGIGATVGSVIPTKGAIIPAAVSASISDAAWQPCARAWSHPIFPMISDRCERDRGGGASWTN